MHLFLYDGVCGLCNRSLRFVIRRLRGDTFRFASIQSAVGREVLLRHGKDPDALVSLFVVSDYQGQERLYERSEAALLIAHHFRYPWKMLLAVRVLPRFVRDWFYDRLAANRYRLFGKFDTCPVPDPRHRALFID
jgi:predicted DCC family thiol-disulfide oxidoreductase YuxK